MRVKVGTGCVYITHHFEHFLLSLLARSTNVQYTGCRVINRTIGETKIIVREKINLKMWNRRFSLRGFVCKTVVLTYLIWSFAKQFVEKEMNKFNGIIYSDKVQFDGFRRISLLKVTQKSVNLTFQQFISGFDRCNDINTYISWFISTLTSSI